MKALVTGGTRGIGLAIAKALMDAGHRVTLTGTRDRGPSLRGAAYLACDFSNRRDVETLAAHVREGQYALLINNAGINKIGLVEKYSLHDFSVLQQVNVTAPFLLCQAAIPFMRKRKFGRIINISSIFGVVSRVGRAAYSASKSSLIGLSRALALETAADNVLINCVAPGFVDTDLTRSSLGAKGIRQLTSQIPMKRLAQPKEIARLVEFLASPANTYITGQNILIDGGYTSA